MRRVVAGGRVWGLRADEGWATVGSNDDSEREVMPFWSDRAYAARAAIDQWAFYVPFEGRMERAAANVLDPRRPPVA